MKKVRKQMFREVLPNIKVRIFWEGHKIWKNLPLKIWHYSVTSNFKWMIFSNFVAFSEYLNFNFSKFFWKTPFRLEIIIFLTLSLCIKWIVLMFNNQMMGRPFYSLSQPTSKLFRWACKYVLETRRQQHGWPESLRNACMSRKCKRL